MNNISLNKKVIVCFHGLNGGPSSWRKFKTYVNNNHPNYSILTLDYRKILDGKDKKKNLENIFEEVKQTIDNKIDFKQNQVYALAHSAGWGILGEYFLENPNIKDKFKKIVTIASPYKGTSLAQLGKIMKRTRNSPMIKDLSGKRGTLIRKLKDYYTQDPLKNHLNIITTEIDKGNKPQSYIFLGQKNDGFVKPKNAEFEKADEQFYLKYGHNSILKQEITYKIIMDFFENNNFTKKYEETYKKNKNGIWKENKK